MAAVTSGSTRQKDCTRQRVKGTRTGAATGASPTRNAGRLAAIAWAAALAIAASSTQAATDPAQKFQTLSAGARWSGNTMTWYYDADNQPAWTDAPHMVALIQQAMAAWSAQCGVQFNYAGTTSNAPTVQDGMTSVAWLPVLDYASITHWYVQDGALSEADIVLNVSANGSAFVAYPMLLHELGHAIGLAHSEVAGSVMAGPPAVSAYSYATTLQPDDVTACQSLYGPPVAAPTQAPLPHVALSTVSAPDATAVEYYHPVLDHYFMTANPDEQNSLAKGGPDGQWRPTGMSFPVWKAAGPVLKPMCRFYGDSTIDPQTGRRKGPNSHFYTAIPDECAVVPQRWPVWIFEGYAFFAATPDGNNACPAGTQPVYRYFKPQGDPNHRYVTTEAGKQEMAARGWLPEGVAWCAGT